MYRLLKTRWLSLIVAAGFCFMPLCAQQPSKTVAAKPTTPTIPVVQPVVSKPVQTTAVTPTVATPAPKITAPVPPVTTPAVTTQPAPATPPAAVPAPSRAPAVTVAPFPAPTPAPTPQPAAVTPLAPTAVAPTPVAEPTVPPAIPGPVAAPSAPEAPKPDTAAAPAVPAPSVTSEEFDTSKIKEYGGNWYLKRHWWEYAEGEYEKARQVLEQLFEARMAFFEKRNQLQRSLFEPFYRTMGFEQGELQDTLVYLIDQIEGARAGEGTLDIKQREFLTALQDEKKTLEQLKLDMDQLSKFDDSINKALDLLMKQINQARQYEQTAWKEFKAIAEDLSDIKARERYYTIKTLYKDIKNISEYVSGDFKKYFDNLADVSHKEADRIKTTVQALKTKGIDLKNEAKKLSEEPSKASAPSCEVKVEEPGYFMSAVNWVGGTLKTTWNYIFGWIYRF